MKISRAVVGLLASSLALAGCAGTSSDGGGGSTAGGELTAVPGFDPADGTIRVGVINPFTGPLAAGGQGLLLGLQLYVDRINAEGGIAGQYPIELVTGDSAYDPQTGLSEYNRMVDDVVMFGEVLGTPIVGAMLPQAAADDVLILPGSDSSDWLRNPNTLLVRPTYEAAISNALSYAVDEQEGTVCALLQDDPTGEAVGRGVDHTVEALDLDEAQVVSFSAGNTDFTPQISQLKAAGCEITVFGAASSTTLPAMASAVQLDFQTRWVSLSIAFADNVLGSPLIDYISDTWVIGAPGAQWADDSVPGMAQLVADYEEYAPEGAAEQPVLNTAGYTYGIAIGQLLEEAVARGDLSHASLLEISQSPDVTLDLLGLSDDVTLGPVDERQTSSAVTIFAVDPTATGGLRALENGYDSEAAQSYQVD